MAGEPRPNVGDQQSKPQFPRLWHKFNFNLHFLPMYEKPDLTDGHLRGILSVRLLGDLEPLQQTSGES